MRSDNRETIHIAITIDDNYLPHAAVMLTSLCQNTPSVFFDIFVLHNGFSGDLQKKLSENLNQYPIFCHFINVDAQAFSTAVLSHHVSVATYWRLLLPDLLPKNLKKVLFLDVDMLIRHSIRDLWQTPIDLFCHAAVENIGDFNSIKLKLGMPAESRYFNAGMMLINLDYWRNFDILKQAHVFLRNRTSDITYWDQDILNHFFVNQWLPLPFHWNVQEGFFLDTTEGYKNLKIDEKTYHQLRHDPAIVHFTGSDKPWFVDNTHPFKTEYINYLRQTSWRNLKFQRRKPSLMKRIGFKILRGVNYFRTL